MPICKDTVGRGARLGRPPAVGLLPACPAPGFALVVAALAVVATFLVDSTAGLWCLAVFAAFMLYFGLYSRHHLVASSPDEEFAALARAEAELE